MDLEINKIDGSLKYSVILFWQEIPETHKLYILDLNPEEYSKIEKCHNKFINCDDSDELNWLSNFLMDKEPVGFDHPIITVGERYLITSGMLM